MRRGFTLIEAIVTVVLVGIIFWVFAFYIRENFDAWKFTVGQKDMTLSSRVAINRVVRELRRMKKNTHIYTHASQEVSFKDVHNNIVTFKQSGSDLLRNSQVLLENLKDPGGLTFIYLDKDGNETAAVDDMRTVRCQLTVETDENKFVVESAARIRVKQIQ
jgi:prepilin-type N-terminal cleavage/methylation domain-containing protein